LRITDEVVALLQAAGPLELRFRNVTDFRDIAIDELANHKHMIRHLDNLLHALLIHVVETYCQMVVASGRAAQVKLTVLEELLADIETIAPWNSATQEDAAELVRQTQIELAAQVASTNA
jgi:hypothetical protein